MKKKIRIIASVDSPLNQSLIEAAIRTLAEEGYAEAVTMDTLVPDSCETPLLVLDGDEQSTTRAQLESHQIKIDFQLVVSQLGIERNEDYKEDDLVLLLDGIKAVCTVTDGPVPQFHCPCCAKP